MKRRLLLFLISVMMGLSAAVGILGCSDGRGNTTPPSDTNVIDGNTPNNDNNTDNTSTDIGNTNTDNGNTPNGNNNNTNNNNTPNGEGNVTNANTTSNKITAPRTTVYYTNSNYWANVYAYMWNSSTDKAKVAWPGERLAAIGNSGFGEKQYSVQVDRSLYDRIIFNNGASGDANRKTIDLVVGTATIGFYGTDGIFSMGNNVNYGSVRTLQLTDSKNLSYIGGAKKTISVYTPSSYTPTKKYGVLYMFDGQNLFTDSTVGNSAASNPWAVDVAVTNLVKNGGDGFIIVAIYNNESSVIRDTELTMSLDFGNLTPLGDPQYGSFRNGKLDQLGNFMKETLMPWVKNNYSVDTSREKTGIAGSSSGGLAAYYLGLRDNDLYGYIGAFSPANGLFDRSSWQRFYQRKNFAGGNKPKIYVYCGQNDNDLEDMLLPAAKQIKDLTLYGFAPSDIIEYYRNGGTHNETYWRIAFTEFVSRLVP